ncbi:FUSC family protein [Streptomyces pristinaespiralis]|uniref:FUSC family protein n=1 Tax=Streptomyces pristinaespiralis TaxID=38300 RepID=UPI0033E82475
MAVGTHVAEAVRGETMAAGRFAKRAVSQPGRERDLAVQSLKAALAAWLAWLIASTWLQAPLAFVAPWVAVVLVRATVYQSFAQGMQQLGAIALGTVLATAGGMALGNPTVAMAVVLPVTMLLSNWGRLGDQGLYSATAALFTLTFADPGVDSAVARLLESLLGAAVGVGVNMLVLPPVYLRSTESALRNVVEESTRTLTSIVAGLTGPWGYRQARDWHQQARHLFSLISQARSALERSRESARLNPNRRRRAELKTLQHSASHSLYVLEQLTEYLSDLTRTLVEASDDRTDNPRPEDGVTALYSQFLHRVADAVDAYGGLVTDGSQSTRERLRTAVEAVRDAQQQLHRDLSRKDTSHPEWMALYGSLLVDARRVTEGLLADAE